jgi:hypothetical protein
MLRQEEHSISRSPKRTFANQRKTAMKRFKITTTLLLATVSTAVLAQAPAANDPHHPPKSGTPAPPSTPGQPGVGGMPMGMMGGMPMMNMMGQMGMMRMMGMTGPGMGGMATIDRVEGRIAFLRTELKITDAQSTAWNAFAEALRVNARMLGELRGSMMSRPNASPQQAPTLADLLEAQERWLLARLEGTRAIKGAFTSLYGALSDDQKKTARELLAPHMGMGPLMMMQGPMQPGQMQPRSMPGGSMQPQAK